MSQNSDRILTEFWSRFSQNSDRISLIFQSYFYKIPIRISKYSDRIYTIFRLDFHKFRSEFWEITIGILWNSDRNFWDSDWKCKSDSDIAEAEFILPKSNWIFFPYGFSIYGKSDSAHLNITPLFSDQIFTFSDWILKVRLEFGNE